MHLSEDHHHQAKTGEEEDTSEIGYLLHSSRSNFQIKNLALDRESDSSTVGVRFE
jgi:hypothetical protein